NYFANGSKAYSKERLEVYSRNRTFVMDNFRRTKGYDVKGFKNLRTRMDKGHKEQFRRYVDFLEKGGEPIISFEEIVNGMRAVLGAVESLKRQEWVEVG